MLRLGGAYEVIRGNIQQRPGAAEGGGNPVSILTRAASFLFRSLGNLFTVLVRAGLETDIITAEPPEAAIGVGDDGGVGMADVRQGIDVVNRGGYGWLLWMSRRFRLLKIHLLGNKFCFLSAQELRPPFF